MKSFLHILAVVALAAPVASHAETKIDFAKDIAPLLEFNCVSCHYEGEVKGGLRMDKASLFWEGGDGGAALVKGKADESLMIELVSLPEDDSDVMPPKGRPLHDHEIAKLKQWIAEGAI